MPFSLIKGSLWGNVSELQIVASHPTPTTPKCVFAVQGEGMSAQNRDAYLRRQL